MRLIAICGAAALIIGACSSGSGTASGSGGTAGTGGTGGSAGECTSSQDCPQPGIMCASADCVQGKCQISYTPGCGTGGSDAGGCVSNQDCPQPGAMCMYAECVQGTCQIKSTPGCGVGGSAGAGGGSCPTAEPTPSSTCTVELQGYCYYGSSICSCDAQGGFVQDGGVSYAWDCGTAPAGCPSTVPTLGTSCTTEGQSCSYDYRPCAQSNPSTYQCTGGSWVLNATPCG